MCANSKYNKTILNIKNETKTTQSSQAWRCTLVIPALGRQRQEEDHKFETSVGYIVRPCLKTKRQKQQTKNPDRRKGNSNFTS
jgi:hypothetical protein